MKKVLVSNGGKMFRKYVLDVKRINESLSLHKKIIRRKDKNGNVRAEYEYFYVLVPRSEEEIEELVSQGKNRKSKVVRYKEKFIGRTPPSNWEKDFLSQLKDEGLIEINKEDMITDEKTWQMIEDELYEYFNDSTVSVYVFN